LCHLLERYPTAAQAHRLAYEAGIIPLVLGGDSVPLDLGRNAT
jgi:hypothetical protein